jgi:serine/threonine protein kinase
MDPYIGRSLGQYTLEARLGGGGFGTVYRASHRILQQSRAIKVMRPEYARDDRLVKLLYREARLAAKLKHPNIVTVHDVSEVDGLHYIVMDLLQGEPLSDTIKRSGGLPWKVVGAIIEQISAALDFAHSGEIAHRDLKPSNIIISLEDDHPKITIVDFGLARTTNASSVSLPTAGTADYMAPERIVDSRINVDDFRRAITSDYYALGIITFELLTGRTPFGGGSYAVMYSHVNTPPPSVRKYVRDIPKSIEEAVERQLRKDPSERYNSATEFYRVFSDENDKSILSNKYAEPITSNYIADDTITSTAERFHETSRIGNVHIIEQTGNRTSHITHFQRASNQDWGIKAESIVHKGPQSPAEMMESLSSQVASHVSGSGMFDPHDFIIILRNLDNVNHIDNRVRIGLFEHNTKSTNDENIMQYIKSQLYAVLLEQIREQTANGDNALLGQSFRLIKALDLEG